MKKIISFVIFLMLLFLPMSSYAFLSSIFGGPSFKYSKQDMKNDMEDIQTELGVVKNNQIELNNKIKAVVKLNNQIQAKLENEINMSNELKSNLDALSNINADLKGQIGSLDSSLTNKLNAEGNIENTTNDPFIFVIAGIIIIGLIISQTITSKALIEKRKERDDYKRSYEDMKNISDKVLFNKKLDKK